MAYSFRLSLGHFILPIAAMLAVGEATAISHAGFFVDSWELITAVNGQSPPDQPYDLGVYDAVQNPFVAAHTATLLGSTAAAAYDFSWTGDEASFGVSVDHHLEQLQGSTSSSGRIYIRPEVDSIVTFSGDWQFTWPGSALGSTLLTLTVWDVAAESVVVAAYGFGGNVGIGPPFGTLQLGESGVIQADRQYILSYSAEVVHYDPTPPGTFGTGNGQLSFTITPVPEPSTLALLALTAAPLRRRPSTRR